MPYPPHVARLCLLAGLWSTTADRELGALHLRQTPRVVLAAPCLVRRRRRQELAAGSFVTTEADQTNFATQHESGLIEHALAHEINQCSNIARRAIV